MFSKKDVEKKLGMLKSKAKNRDIFIFFTILLIPNILRQVLYWAAFLKTGQLDFIVSFETQAIYQRGFPFVGIFEEIIIGIIFTFL